MLELLILIAFAVAVLIWRSFFPSYMAEKAKNLATKEDINGLTHQIESVKAQYAEILEDQRGRHQLRLAGIDKRLQVHQEAFALWWQLVNADELSYETADECAIWWVDNCLYLEPAARTAFHHSYSSVWKHKQLLKKANYLSPDLEIKASWASIMATGDILMAAVKLPGLTQEEKSPLSRPEMTGEKGSE